jgi:putative membrane protein
MPLAGLPPTALHAAGGGGPWAAWSADPAVVIGLIAAAALFAQGWVRLRRRAGPAYAGVGRLVLFVCALAVLALAIFSPLDHVGEEYLASAHMVQHLLLADLAPLLVVFAISGPLALFVVPRPVLRPAARSGPLRAVLATLLSPWVALAIWAAVMAGWHLPGPYQRALQDRMWHDLEHASMFAAGFLLWLVIAGAVPRVRRGRITRAGVAVAALAVGMVISQYLFLADPLYATYIEQPERLFGLSPKADQVQAAMLMTGAQILTLGTAAGLLLWSHVERAHAPHHDAGSSAAAQRDPHGRGGA